jgi:hypothetical protein
MLDYVPPPMVSAGHLSSPTKSTFATEATVTGPQFLTSVDEIYQMELLANVGEESMRFGPHRTISSSVQEDLRAYPVLMKAFVQLKVAAEKEKSSNFSDNLLLRVLQYKDGNVSKALKLLRRMDMRYLTATARQLQDQLRTKTLFPLPQGLRAKKNSRLDTFFYMKPSRYTPSETPTPTIIANLVYSMDTLYERHRNYGQHQIGFIANMNDWSMRHFSIDYCWQFMQALQGRAAPLNVDMFLIVNPPDWFDKVWKIMKPMLSGPFRRKVHMIQQAQLGDFLEPGFELHLPDEMASGHCPVPQLIEDFIALRSYREETSLDRLSNGSSGWVWPTETAKHKPVEEPDSADPSAPRRHRLLPRRQESLWDIDEKLSDDQVLPNRTKSADDVFQSKKLVRQSSWSNLEDPWDTQEYMTHKSSWQYSSTGTLSDSDLLSVASSSDGGGSLIRLLE